MDLGERLTSLRYPSAVHYLHVRKVNIVENRPDELYRLNCFRLSTKCIPHLLPLMVVPTLLGDTYISSLVFLPQII